MVASVQVTTSDLARLSHALEEAGQVGLRTEFRKAMRLNADRIVKAEKAAVMELSSKAKHTKKQTAQFAASELRGRKSVNINQFDNAIRHAGLRRSIANSIGRIIRYKGDEVGVVVRVHSSKMPPGMEKLPRLTNRGKWGHPFLGRRDIWVDQTTSPPSWWENTGRREYPQVRADIELVIKAYAAKLARATGGY